MRSTLITLHQSPQRSARRYKALIQWAASGSLAALCILPVLGTAREVQAQAIDANLAPVPTDEARGNREAAMQALLTPRFEIEFQDIPVADLLITIAKQGGVEIAIKGDVSGTLKFVHYKNVTAEEAIERVAADAGLFWGRRKDQYVVARVLEDLDPELQKKYLKNLPVRTVENGHSGPRASITGGNNRVTGGSFENLPNFGPAIRSNNGDEGGGITTRTPNWENFEGLELASAKNAKRGKETRVIKVHNVPPAMMAHWLDPKNHPPDFATENSMIQREAGRMREHTIRPLATLKEINPTTGMHAQVAPSPYPYPYPTPAYAMPYGMPASPYAAAPQGYYPQGYYPNQPAPYYNSVRSVVPLSAILQNVPQEETWSSRANAWGPPRIIARPQFGPGGQQGGQGQGGQGGQAAQGAVFDLPEGIDSMAAIDAQNALLIRGTAQAVEELQQIIEQIDQPLKQVEIEAQFVSLTTSETKNFGINFSAINGPFSVTGATTNTSGNFTLGYVGRNFQATLQAALNNNRAKVVTAPRVVAINNLTASIFTTTVTTVVLQQSIINNGNGNNQVLANTVPIQINTSVGIQVVPTINGDGTITVLMQPTVQQQSPSTDPDNPFPSITSQTVNTVAIVKDGDTIALGGLRNKGFTYTRQRLPVLGSIPILGKLFQGTQKADTDADLIIFLTARIIRRADDDAVPGT
jgi:type II secretory pathway component GspD/PulD (secretin)